MPAVRSRTENWRRSLQQLLERKGCLEITLPSAVQRNSDGVAITHEDQPGAVSSIIWRVRILALDEDSILVERPEALGAKFPIQDGIDLVGVIAIGQNRWMFNTKSLGTERTTTFNHRAVEALLIEMPDDVERCQRRSFYRVSTINLNLPSVEGYQLPDPQSAVAAETACRKTILDRLDRGVIATIAGDDDEPLLPPVGAKATAVLHNLGGGGVGLIFDQEESGILRTNATYWLRIHLNHFVPAPLAVTARLRHDRVDSQNRTQGGFAFDFSCNPSHQAFIMDQLCRYTALVQRDLTRGVEPEGEDDGSDV